MFGLSLMLHENERTGLIGVINVAGHRVFYELLRRWGGGGGERVAGYGNFFVLTQKRKISSPHIGALVF